MVAAPPRDANTARTVCARCRRECWRQSYMSDHRDMAHPPQAAPDRTSDSRDIADTCGAIVLAAGEARRFGSPKLLMPFGDSTVLGSVITALATAGVAPIVVVAGAGAAAIEVSVKEGPAEVIRNPDPSRGMISSIRVGVAALPKRLNRFLVALGDQPRIRAEDVSGLLSEHRRSGKGIALPTYKAKRGHPVLFHSSYRQAILALTDDQTLRDLIHAHADDCLEVAYDSDAYVRDIDTQEQYEDELRRSHSDQ
jgi:molybdenum cofactor cytidylyltransferase